MLKMVSYVCDCVIDLS